LGGAGMAAGVGWRRGAERRPGGVGWGVARLLGPMSRGREGGGAAAWWCSSASWCGAPREPLVAAASLAR